MLEYKIEKYNTRKSMAELTQEQIAAQDKAKEFIRSELGKSAEDSAIVRIKTGALKEFRKDLEEKYGGDTQAIDKKMAAASQKFDEQLIEKASKGAVTKGNVGAFKKDDPEKAQARQGAGNILEALIGMVGGFFGSIGSFLIGLLQMFGLGKALGGAADTLADTVTNRSPEERKRDEIAAGVAESLDAVRIGSRRVAIHEEDRKIIFEDIRRDLEGSAPVPNVAAANQAATGIKPGGVTQDNFNAPNGTTVSAPATGPSAPSAAAGIGQ